MAVTERLMQAGQWSLSFAPDTPKSIRDLIDFFGHVYIFDGPMRPGLADATMIASARWAGIVRRKQTPFDMAGANMIAWLGDEDGKGPIIETAVNGVGATFATYVGLLLPAAVASGSLGPVAGTQTLTYQWVSPRQAIDNLCGIFGAEYRVNKDATFDAGVSSYLFRTSPTAVAMRRSSGRDLAVVGISTTRLEIAVDAEDYMTRALIQDAGGTYYGITGGVGVPYKDLRGNAVSLTKVSDSLTTGAAPTNALATNLVNAGQVLRQEVTLDSDEFDLPRDVAAGDYIGVYDPDSGTKDETNPVRYRGETIYPFKVRVMAVTWPIERGMGVWYRDLNGKWTELTNYVMFEPAGATLEVGAATRRFYVPRIIKEVI
jgi:hypothetical protein